MHGDDPVTDPTTVTTEAVRATPERSAWVYGNWYCAMHDSVNYVRAVNQISTGDVVEMRILDGDGVQRGSVICRVQGQTFEVETGLPLHHVEPIAAEQPSVDRWMRANLASPNCVHFVRNSRMPPYFGEPIVHVQLVTEWRIRPPEGLTEALTQRAPVDVRV